MINIFWSEERANTKNIQKFRMITSLSAPPFPIGEGGSRENNNNKKAIEEEKKGVDIF